jgi:hypothetical protein
MLRCQPVQMFLFSLRLIVLIYYHMRAKVFASLLLCRLLFLERLQEVMNVIAILHSLYGFLEFVFLQLSC